MQLLCVAAFTGSTAGLFVALFLRLNTKNPTRIAMAPTAMPTSRLGSRENEPVESEFVKGELVVTALVCVRGGWAVIDAVVAADGVVTV